ncbi:MAG: carbamoyl-phosphate synthase large subunit, partial [Chromatiales bacterium]|nr:carbamoyl-phosphate synthase large subunit [Chromatiales bacterium]
DKHDNCVIVCGIENLDPMGVHTGDSITVAPILTLTDKEYQRLRDAAIEILRAVGVETGGSNVQFAVNPEDGDLVVIEMNPRVSRSSALASKATGFPIAKFAAKLAVGYTLDEIRNDITKETPASFEPALDYVVVKMPRFAFEKFPNSDPTLGTQMKSVGETMAIGRTFKEAFQKALRGLEVDRAGFSGKTTQYTPEELPKLLATPTPGRLFAVYDALKAGHDVDEIYRLSGIDPWFLAHMQQLVAHDVALEERNGSPFEDHELRALKAQGFSDAQIASSLGKETIEIDAARSLMGVHPGYRLVDTCAGEFAALTPYFYSTYDCTGDEVQPSGGRKVMILGGGPNRIGQGIEFDYCCVHAAYALSEAGYETIMVNCNPETVSTDYDTSDRLYFEPLTLEDVLEVIHKEQPAGVIVQYGGQTPLKLANDLEAAGAPIIGTSPDSIDLAEDRERFQQLIEKLNLKQPPNRTARDSESAVKLAEEIGYPLVVRPSYVLGGRAMEIVYHENELRRYMREAVSVSNDSPVLLDRFLDDAIEVDIDAICDGEEVLIGGIMEHIEQAGVHSGDSACSLPPYTLSAAVQDRMREQMRKLALELKVVGLMNAQFAIKDDQIYLLEVNPRASRTVPFVSKATGLQLAKIAARCMAGTSLKEQGISKEVVPENYFVKEAVFPFVKFPGVDTVLGPEMKSTGEVMGVGATFGEAYNKSIMGAGYQLPQGGKALLSVRNADKVRAVQVAQDLVELGFTLSATGGTCQALLDAGLECTRVNKVMEGRPHIVDSIKNQEVSFIINTTEGVQAIADSAEIRRTALQHKVNYTTTISGAEATCLALKQLDELNVNRLQDLHQQ